MSRDNHSASKAFGAKGAQRGSIGEPAPRCEVQATPVSYTCLDVRPRRGLRREDAAHYVGVSPTKFDQLVSDGRMPQPFRLDGCVLWDVRKLDAAIDLISNADEAEDSREIEL